MLVITESPTSLTRNSDRDKQFHYHVGSTNILSDIMVVLRQVI